MECENGSHGAGSWRHQIFLQKSQILFIYLVIYLFIYLSIINQKQYSLQANVMTIHSTPRYHVLLWCRRVFIQRCHVRCLASLKASVVLVSCCLQFAVVAVIVAWEGLPICCDVYWVFHRWLHLCKGCWSLYVEYELLHTGVHLLWLWEFWIGISAWWLCWTCWHNPTVQFSISVSVWLPLGRWAICFL